jgi:hypothetical protein
VDDQPGARHFTSMYRVVAEPIPAVVPPRGIRIRHCTSEWFEAARVAKNDAFRDHWAVSQLMRSAGGSSPEARSSALTCPGSP